MVDLKHVYGTSNSFPPVGYVSSDVSVYSTNTTVQDWLFLFPGLAKTQHKSHSDYKIHKLLIKKLKIQA